MKFRFLLLVCFAPALASATEADKIFDACWPATATHVEASQCLGKALQARRNTLEATYEKASKRAKSVDRDMTKSNMERYANQHAKLETSQRQFQRYVKAECGRVLAAYTNGNGGGDAYAVCEIRLIDQRLAQLKD